MSLLLYKLWVNSLTEIRVDGEVTNFRCGQGSDIGSGYLEFFKLVCC